MYGKGLIKGMAITIKHYFGPKMTQQYPEEKPVLQKRFRGHLCLKFEQCKACGICVRSCPNGALSFTDAKDEATKKKKLMTYTIEHQYCMFCNLCVEACPQGCLYFDHGFELSRYTRDQLKTIYHRPPEMDKQEQETKEAGTDNADNSGTEKEAAADKREKQLNALLNAFNKNPQKLLAKYVENQEQAAILANILQADPNKAQKILGLIVDDKEKAQKAAQALVNKQIKGQAKGGNDQ